MEIKCGGPIGIGPHKTAQTYKHINVYKVNVNNVLYKINF